MNKRFITKVWTIIIVFLAICPEHTYAQLETNSNKYNVNYALPSPEASALTKVGDIPVDLSTGAANISIPLYEINTGGIKIPIVLTYDASGIKVEQQASAVGLGWSLTCGGAITRKVRDKDDFGTGDSYKDMGGLNWLNYFPDPGSYMKDLWFTTAVTANHADAITDIYNYNFNGLTGQFIKPDNVAVLIPKANIDIRGGYDSWKAVDGSGYTYYLGGNDADGHDATETNSLRISQTPPLTDLVVSYRTSWWLTKIINETKSDEVDFVYDEGYIEYPAGKTFSRSFDVFNFGETTTNASIEHNIISPLQRTNSKTLKKIEFNNGTVEFLISKTNRADLLSTSNQPRIEKMIVTDKQGNEIREIQFYYDYFTAAGTPLTPDNYRLKLTRIKVQNGSLPAEEYNFTYNSTVPLPIKTSYAQDYWGYYNGKVLNNTLIPKEAYMLNLPSGGHFPFLDCGGPSMPVFDGADRNVHAEFLQAGMLTGITYPTGGEVNFTYEPHSIASSVNEYTPSIISVGGFVEKTSATTAVTPDGPTSVGSNGTATYVMEFDIPNNAETVNGVPGIFRASASGSGGTGAPHANAHMTLNHWDMNNVHTQEILSDGCLDNIMFYPGHHTLVASVSGTGYMAGGSVICVIKEQVTTIHQNKDIGGLRIKGISYKDPFTNIVKNDLYTYENPATGLSSGYMHTPINMSSYVKTNFIYQTGNFGCMDKYGLPSTQWCCFKTVAALTFSSFQKFEAFEGSPIYYQYVTKHNGMGDIGGSELNEFNREMTPNFTWRNKTLLSNKVFDNAGTQVAQTDYLYDSYVPMVERYWGFDIKSLGNHPCAAEAYFTTNPTLPTNSLYDYHYSINTVLTTSEWYRLVKKTSSNFNNLANPLVQTEDYEYNPLNLELSKVITNRSDGRKNVQYFKYPVDYSIPTGTSPATDLSAISVLNNEHTANKIVEQYSAINDNGVEKVTGGSYIGYTPVLSSLVTETTPSGPVSHYTAVQTDKLFKTETAQPLTSFQPSTVATGSGSSFVSKDATYKLQASILKYDARLNPTEVLDAHGFKTSLLWMYNKELQTCEVKNAGQDEIAYTSFEDPDNTGNWTYSASGVTTSDKMTGTKCFNLGMGNVTTPGVQQPQIISYWRKGGSVTVNGTAPGVTNALANGWVYCQHVLSGDPTYVVSGTGLIDELRYYPQNATMKTYCHAPLVGMITSCDERNGVQYYEYDSNGRLIAIRDQVGNILKKLEYAVQQPE